MSLLVGALLLPAAAGCGRPEAPAGPRRAEAPAATEPVRVPAGLGARYVVEVLDPPRHLLRVTVEAPLAEGEEAPEAWMPVWTPGSYLVREHARHVERFEAFGADGRPLPVRKVAKNRWRVQGEAGAAVRYRYTLYAHELSVRTAFLADDYGVLDPAAVFVALAGREDRPLQVRFELPEGWRLRTLLRRHPEAAEGEPRFAAPSFEALVDAPALLAPDLQEDRFEVDGVPHALVYVGRTDRWDRERALRDVRRIVEQQRDFWGGLPYRRYAFLQVLDRFGGGSGLEHAEGTLLLVPPLASRRREDYRDWLGLVSHELFHAWNVKRLRPAELRRYELNREQPTPSLWIAEGLTSYYDDLLLCRAELLDEAAYLRRLSRQVRSVQRTPGRRWQSLTEASWDAWIKFYRPDEHTPNQAVSYYRKGAVVGWLLDAAIREATGGRRSLDDAMRLALRRFAETGYTHAQFRAVLEEVAGRSLADFYQRYVEGTEELDYEPALRWFGLRFAPPEPTEEAEEEREPPRAWLGVRTEGRGGRLLLEQVLRDGPAWRAGLSAGDELLAIDGFRVRGAEALGELLRRLRPGERVEVLVARRTRLRTAVVELGEAPAERAWELEPDPAASGVQRARRRAWLLGEGRGLGGLLQSGSP